MGMILSLSLALQFFVILAPFLMQWVVDQVLVSADKDLPVSYTHLDVYKRQVHAVFEAQAPAPDRMCSDDD